MCPRGHRRGQGRPRGLHLFQLQLARKNILFVTRMVLLRITFAYNLIIFGR